MSKNSKESTKKQWYKSALLPWAVIVVAVVFFSGVISGWTMRSEQEAQLDAVRTTALAEVKPVDSK